MLVFPSKPYEKWTNQKETIIRQNLWSNTSQKSHPWLFVCLFVFTAKPLSKVLSVQVLGSAANSFPTKQRKTRSSLKKISETIPFTSHACRKRVLYLSLYTISYHYCYSDVRLFQLICTFNSFVSIFGC